MPDRSLQVRREAKAGAKQPYLLMSLPVEGGSSPLPLQCERGDQALNLGSLAVGLAVLALEAAPVGVDILAHIIVLGQVEQLPDLGGSLGTPHAGLVIICQPRQIPRACSTSNNIPT